MPKILEADALQTAAGTFPPAKEVKAMADCTVPGSTHKNNTPMYSCCPSKGTSTGLARIPISGNNKKVQENTSRCRRQ